MVWTTGVGTRCQCDTESATLKPTPQPRNNPDPRDNLVVVNKTGSVTRFCKSWNGTIGLTGQVQQVDLSTTLAGPTAG
jgi:hypothetical protein